ncbi:MAG: response regulator, partial [Spirochaetota bacterium]
MKNKLRILILEDVAADAELMEHELRKENLAFSSRQVDTKKAFLRELKNFKPDVVLSDYKLSQFDGMAALTLVNDFSPLTPFIIVTGSMNEETAVACMKAGAADYVIKDHPVRLVPAVKAALEKQRIREEKQKNDRALQTAAQEWRKTFDAIEDGIALLSADKKFTRCNKALAIIINRPFNDILGRTCFELICKNTVEDSQCPFNLMLKSRRRETLILKLDHRWFKDTVDPVFDKEGNIAGAVHTLTDITELKQAEEKIKEDRNFRLTLIDNIPDFIYIKDKKGRFLLGNRTVTE